MNFNKNLTQKELKKTLEYDPLTGEFIRLIANGSGDYIGDVAGGLVHKYIRIMMGGKIYSAHRLAWLYMTGKWPKDQIDHINHIRGDNRWVNLREATSYENQRNRPLLRNNKSGINGIRWDKNRWVVTVGVDGANIHLGRFADKFEAICARKSADNKYDYHPNHGAKL